MSGYLKKLYLWKRSAKILLNMIILPLTCPVEINNFEYIFNVILLPHDWHEIVRGINYLNVWQRFRSYKFHVSNLEICYRHIGTSSIQQYSFIFWNCCITVFLNQFWYQILISLFISWANVHTFLYLKNDSRT